MFVEAPTRPSENDPPATDAWLPSVASFVKIWIIPAKPETP